MEGEERTYFGSTIKNLNEWLSEILGKPIEPITDALDRSEEMETEILEDRPLEEDPEVKEKLRHLKEK